MHRQGLRRVFCVLRHGVGRRCPRALTNPLIRVSLPNWCFVKITPHRLCMRLRIGALPALGAGSKKILATNTFAALVARNSKMLFAAELKTQSLERAFATALGLEFRPSADNLNADVEAFSAALTDDETALNAWLISTSGQRARRFLEHLSLLKTSLAEKTSADNAHDSQSGAVQ